MFGPFVSRTAQGIVAAVNNRIILVSYTTGSCSVRGWFWSASRRDDLQIRECVGAFLFPHFALSLIFVRNHDSIGCRSHSRSVRHYHTRQLWPCGSTLLMSTSDVHCVRCENVIFGHLSWTRSHGNAHFGSLFNRPLVLWHHRRLDGMLLLVHSESNRCPHNEMDGIVSDDYNRPDWNVSTGSTY